MKENEEEKDTTPSEPSEPKIMYFNRAIQMITIIGTAINYEIEFKVFYRLDGKDGFYMEFNSHDDLELAANL